jgi:CheY-like chemotaxis protein
MGNIKKVLIVDDDEGVRLFVEAIMTDLGWLCIDAQHGEEALFLAEQEQPDLVILDIHMPVMDGLEAFRRLRDNPFTAEIPIIMLTAANEKHSGVPLDAERMELAFGFSRPEGFVDKPVDGDYLTKCIMGVVG